MAAELRCKYEVLGLRNDCTAEEIRSAYKNLALQRHPDKLVQSGLSDVEATALFQELVSAYEVLSDPKERAWYDSHRFESDDHPHAGPGPNSDSVIPDLSPYRSTSAFSDYTDSARGFYKVYSDLFDQVYTNELSFARKLGVELDGDDAPRMGNSSSSYSQVNAFYSYWSVFSTVMDYGWVDQFDTKGLNRKSRKVMEEENRKLRNNAKREYNKTVRQLAAFVKKMDKRVIHIQVLKRVEMEKKRAATETAANEELDEQTNSSSRRRRDEQRKERRLGRRRWWDISFASSSSMLQYVLLGLLLLLLAVY